MQHSPGTLDLGGKKLRYLKGEMMVEESEDITVQMARTYRLSPELVDAIDGMASAYGAPQSRIVGILLRIGLEELEAGRRHVLRRPIRYALELG